MIRDALTPGARHAFVFATPTAVRGIAFQRRPTAGGLTVHTGGPAAAPPAWLRLRREGNVVSAFSRPSEAAAWTLIGTQTFSALSDSVYVGFAVTSHTDGVLAEARFDNVSLNAITPPPTFQSNDVGAVGAAGRSSTDGTTYTVTGSGADVWDTVDEFHFFSREVTGDFAFSARVASVQNVDGWTKAGLMLRDGLAANARHAFVLATPTSRRGVAFQRRPATGGISVHTAGPAVAPPRWIRLVRTGNVISAYERSTSDGAWTSIGTQTFTSLPATVRVGFAVVSHLDGTLATATFDNVSLTQ
jgi:regulation of enolase protein 1 (concanavalin A-like superfamily)